MEEIKLVDKVTNEAICERIGEKRMLRKNILL